MVSGTLTAAHAGTARRTAADSDIVSLSACLFDITLHQRLIGVPRQGGLYKREFGDKGTHYLSVQELICECQAFQIFCLYFILFSTYVSFPNAVCVFLFTKSTAFCLIGF